MHFNFHNWKKFSIFNHAYEWLIREVETKHMDSGKENTHTHQKKKTEIVNARIYLSFPSFQFLLCN